MKKIEFFCDGVFYVYNAKFNLFGFYVVDL